MPIINAVSNLKNIILCDHISSIYVLVHIVQYFLIEKLLEKISHIFIVEFSYTYFYRFLCVTCMHENGHHKVQCIVYMFYNDRFKIKSSDNTSVIKMYVGIGICTLHCTTHSLFFVYKFLFKNQVIVRLRSPYNVIQSEKPPGY